MQNYNELAPDNEYNYLTLEKEEVEYLYSLYEKYISESCSQIEKENQSSLDRAQAVYYYLSDQIRYYWYLTNYIDGFERDENEGLDTSYGLELLFEDAEQLAKVIYQYDQEKKLFHLIENTNTLQYFYENLEATSK